MKRIATLLILLSAFVAGSSAFAENANRGIPHPHPTTVTGPSAVNPCVCKN